MSKGRFGVHGGQYIPETLMNAVIELEEAYARWKDDPGFVSELEGLLKDYAGRPSLLYYAEKMTKDLGGAKVYLKREDLNHTGSHKLNNVLGQVLLAKRMGKTRVIAETGAGQHGVATATAAALMGMECEIYMGEEDTVRQALNVYRMELLGAKVHPVKTGTRTLKDAVNETLREWTARVSDTHYVLGSVMGPHPFPTIVRDFQSVIGREVRAQLRGGRARGGDGRDRRDDRGGHAGDLPRHEELFLPGRVRADRAGLLDLGGARLPGHRPRARLAARYKAGGIRLDHRRRGGGRV